MLHTPVLIVFIVAAGGFEIEKIGKKKYAGSGEIFET